MEAEAKIAILESKVAALQEELTVARKVAQEEHGKASRATRTLGRKENGDRQLIAELIAFLDYVGIQELIDKRDLFKDASKTLKSKWHALERDKEWNSRYDRGSHVGGFGLSPRKQPGGGRDWIALTQFFDKVIREAVLAGMAVSYDSDAVDDIVDSLRKKNLGW